MDKAANYHSKAKDFVRTIATEKIGNPAKFSIVFASVDALSTKQNFKTGNFINKSKLIPVEQEPLIRPLVDKVMGQLTKNTVPALACSAHSIPLEKHLDIKKGEKLDYTFYDICGNETVRIARWFYLYQEYLENGMRLPMTIQVGSKRGFGYSYDAVNNATNGNFNSFVHNLLRKQGTEITLLSSSISPAAWESLYAQIYLIYCSMPSKEIEFKSIHIYNNADIVDREEGQIGKLAEDMAMIDMVIHDREELDTVILSKLKKIVNCYNELISDNTEIIELKHRVRKSKAKKMREKKPMKIYNPPRFVNAHEIARHLGIYGNYKSMDDVPQGKQSWIKIHAKQNSLDPIVCFNKIKQRLSRRK
jgi:hypothetical protein